MQADLYHPVLCFPHPSLSPYPPLGFVHISGGKSAIASGSDGDLRRKRDAGEILDGLLLLHVLHH